MTKAVGILGGGQLSLMLYEAAEKLGLNVSALTKEKTDPVARFKNVTFGDPSSKEAVLRWASEKEILTIESEFLPVEKWPEISSKLIPSIESLRFLRNKANQKKLAAQLKLPSVDFEIFDDKAPREWVEKMCDRFGGTAVLKWAEQGYDGKGVCIATGWNDRVKNFMEEGREIYAERKVKFEKEIAMVAARCAAEMVFYPPVVNESKENVCHKIYGKGEHFGVSEKMEKEMQNAMEKIGDKTGYIGTFATEWFLDGEKVYLNEVAPRVHNSGHCTLESSATSQFENHWRAILGMKLGSTRSKEYFVMWNLLPNSEKENGPPKVPAGTALHWYGKKDARRGRKMGHVNGTVESREAFDKLMKDLETMERTWYKG